MGSTSTEDDPGQNVANESDLHQPQNKCGEDRPEGKTTAAGIRHPAGTGAVQGRRAYHSLWGDRL